MRDRQRERERERGRDIGRGRSRLHAGSLMWDLIPGLRDHALSQRQMLNHGAHHGLWIYLFIYLFLNFYLFMMVTHTEREREREREGQRDRPREKQASCWKPDMGLDPGTPGSYPRLKAGAKPQNHPGIPSTSLSTGSCR